LTADINRLYYTRNSIRDRDTVDDIATRYGLDRLGIECWWGRNFPHPSRPVLEPTQPPLQWVPFFPGSKAAQGVALTTHFHLVPRLKKASIYNSTPPLRLRGRFYVDLNLYFYNYFHFLLFSTRRLKPMMVYTHHFFLQHHDFERLACRIAAVHI